MSTGMAKKIKRKLREDRTIADPDFEYFNLNKSNRQKKLLNNIPKKMLKTKRHDGEDYGEFKERRKKSNERRRRREKEHESIK